MKCMLEIKKIKKQYQTGDFIQVALKGVSLSFRDNEFVSILGPSGSGKTTLLNIIGGLDSYDDGDLLINGISTKNYTDRDWDTYRNHSIGFVFQSYNLIPHQSVLSNVELALTISGESKSQRRQKAKDALIKVGLGDHVHKKPNQLSGGQMQRVAIARALVNNPDILLADEPTGALDTETSVQIMELLKEVAQDRLVVMVTHNPELAQTYSSRIVDLKDGNVISDTNPFTPKPIKMTDKKLTHKKAKMSLLTALSLSFNNLKTKKKRTLLTSFAGSIGIIGIALILSLSSGVNTYITDLQSTTMEAYPVTITAEYVNMMGMPMGGQSGSEEDREGIYRDTQSLEMMSSMTGTNNLSPFKEYLDDSDSDIAQYIGSDGVTYSYDIHFDAYSYNENGQLLNTNSDPSALSSNAMMQMNTINPMLMMMGTGANNGATNFFEIESSGDALINTQISDNFEVLEGAWPKEYNEVVLFLDENNAVDIDVLYQLGLVSAEEYLSVTKAIEEGEDVTQQIWNYDELMGRTFYLTSAEQKFVENENGVYVAQGDAYFAANPTTIPVENEVKIVGIVREKEDSTSMLSTSAIGYTTKLSEYLIDQNNNSAVVQAQIATPDVDVLTGLPFVEGKTSYEENLVMIGEVNKANPVEINIYTDSFEDKDALALAIEEYNTTQDEANQITYTDYVAVMTSSMTSMIDVVSYVLIAFVAVSLIVSCIMIGIITHISVLERTKEIGVLRALGASKGNISQVFNAETLIIGLCSGSLGIGIAMLLNIPITSLIQNLIGNSDVATSLPIASAIILIAISVVITVLGGLIPAKTAAKKDPVIALRSE